MEVQLVLRDLLFLTFRVDAMRLRAVVPAELEPDVVRRDGIDLGFVSVVCFHAAEVRTNLLPVSSLSFDQINCRAYLKNDGGSAVYFFQMKVNSRMVAAAASLVGAPLGHEAIKIESTSDSSRSSARRLRIDSPGFEAAVTVDGPRDADPDTGLPSTYITERSIGYATAGKTLYRFSATHPALEVVPVKVDRLHCPVLASVGFPGAEESPDVVSALYAREARFDATSPSLMG